MLPPSRPRMHAVLLALFHPSSSEQQSLQTLFMCLVRLRWQDANPLRPSRAFTIGEFLLQVGEHTWGLDVKTFLGDYANWDNKGFHELVEAGAWNYSWGPVLLYPSSMAASAAASPLSWLH